MCRIRVHLYELHSSLTSLFLDMSTVCDCDVCRSDIANAILTSNVSVCHCLVVVFILSVYIYL